MSDVVFHRAALAERFVKALMRETLGSAASPVQAWCWSAS